MRVVAVLVLGVVGLLGLASPAPSATEPRKCCIDKQFTAVLGDIGAVGAAGNSLFFLDGTVSLSYDFYQQKTRTYTRLQNPDGSVTVTDELHDFINRVVYTTYGNGTCMAGPLKPYDFMFDGCVPGDATYLGPAVFGQGLYSLRVNTWSFLLPVNGSQSWEITMSFTDQHCVPVVEIMNGHVDGAPIEQSLFYTAYRPGLDSAVSFAPAPNCRTSGANVPPIGR